MNNNTNASNNFAEARRSGVVVSGFRRLGLVGATVVIGAAAVAACGSDAPQSASLPPVPEGRVVSPILVDPGPAHAPDAELLEVIRNGSRAAPVVEFGGLPAPVGEPVLVSRPATSVVEFGGATAPFGWPNWEALAESPAPVEFGGLPAPVGEPGSTDFDGGLEPGAHVGPR